MTISGGDPGEDSPSEVVDVGRASGILADRRVWIGVVAALLVVSGGVWGLFVHQPGPDEPTEPPFDDDEQPADGAYRVVGHLGTTGDGETFTSEWVRVYAPGDPPVAVAHWTVDGSDGGRTVAVYERGDRSYARETLLRESAFREAVERRRNDSDVVRVSTDTRTIYEVDRDEDGVDPSPPSSLVASVLATLPYERAGSTTYEGREVARYVPRSGWTAPSGGGAETRVRAAGGEVLVDPETGALLYADVEATVVEAGTWWEALTGRTFDVTARYRVETGVERPETPPWVGALAANSTAGNATAG